MAYFLLLFSYLLGSLPIGFLLVRLIKGVDVREHGSGNIGTVNVGRVAGPWVAALVLVGDALKGALPVLAAGQLGLDPAWGVAAALMAILGHNWSIFLGFKGGKGVATSLGAVIALAPAVAGLAALVWLVAVLLTRISSVGSMLGGVAAPVLLYVLDYPPSYVLFGLLVGALILWRHKANIQRLLRGEELTLDGRPSRRKG